MSKQKIDLKDPNLDHIAERFESYSAGSGTEIQSGMMKLENTVIAFLRYFPFLTQEEPKVRSLIEQHRGKSFTKLVEAINKE